MPTNFECPVQILRIYARVIGAGALELQVRQATSAGSIATA